MVTMKKFLKISGLLLIFFSTNGYSETFIKDKTEPTSHAQIILIQIDVKINGESFPAFKQTSSSPAGGNVSIGIGDFQTGGEPANLVNLNYLSDESRLAGWTYFKLAPGNYYLTILPPFPYGYLKTIHTIPRWKFSIPDEPKIIYAGTIIIPGTSTEGIIEKVKLEHLLSYDGVVENKINIAKDLINQHMSGSDVEVLTSLLKKHNGPIFLEHPLDN